MANSLYKYVEALNLEIIEDIIPVKNTKGLYFDNVIVLDKRIETQAEKNCVLAEEIGHYETSSGNILNPSNVINIKQEQRARKWAHYTLIPIERLIEAYLHPCKSRFETAEFLGVTELFLNEVLDNYKQQFGMYKVFGQYVIYFDPLCILKMYND